MQFLLFTIINLENLECLQGGNCSDYTLILNQLIGNDEILIGESHAANFNTVHKYYNNLLLLVLREQSCNKSGIKRKLGFLKHRPAYRSCRRRLSSNEDKSKLVNNQRREINKILEVDDPVEQIERLAKYLSEKKKELAINNKVCFICFH